MPPLGTRLIDTEALALLERWIYREIIHSRGVEAMNRPKQTCVWPVTGMLLLGAMTFATDPVRAADSDASKIARGKYLVTTSVQ